MKYNMEWVFEKVKEGEQKYIFFWGHHPSKDGTITKTCFSQWWLSEFTVNGIQYKTAEHWMMAKKAELFSDEETLSKILNAKTPAEAKKLGREVKGYDDAKWLEKRFELVVEGNFYKFSQHKDLQEYLLSTNNRILVEASPVDAIWGVGLAADNPDINNPVNWKGLNLLGFALMEVRDKLKL
ncbi:MAG: NADAR family protein [Chitinophagaceae bacterium]|nr:NADAR family protein [Chitinophagaceae bacterium]